MQVRLPGSLRIGNRFRYEGKTLHQYRSQTLTRSSNGPDGEQQLHSPNPTVNRALKRTCRLLYEYT